MLRKREGRAVDVQGLEALRSSKQSTPCERPKLHASDRLPVDTFEGHTLCEQ